MVILYGGFEKNDPLELILSLLLRFKLFQFCLRGLVCYAILLYLDCIPFLSCLLFNNCTFFTGVSQKQLLLPDYAIVLSGRGCSSIVVIKICYLNLKQSSIVLSSIRRPNSTTLGFKLFLSGLLFNNSKFSTRVSQKQLF